MKVQQSMRSDDQTYADQTAQSLDSINDLHNGLLHGLVTPWLRRQVEHTPHVELSKHADNLGAQDFTGLITMA